MPAEHVREGLRQTAAQGMADGDDSIVLVRGVRRNQLTNIVRVLQVVVELWVVLLPERAEIDVRRQVVCITVAAGDGEYDGLAFGVHIGLGLVAVVLYVPTFAQCYKSQSFYVFPASL